jgi:hypothetical protein
MPAFTRLIAPYVKKELAIAKDAQRQGDAELAFAHLERAHVLGQASTYWHVYVHIKMLLWAVKNSQPVEFFGQVVRIIGAFLLTAIKGVPEGNTGGSNVSLVTPMPIPSELKSILEKVKKQCQQ